MSRPVFAALTWSLATYLSGFYHIGCGGTPYAYSHGKVECLGCGYAVAPANGDEPLGITLAVSEFEKVPHAG